MYRYPAANLHIANIAVIGNELSDQKLGNFSHIVILVANRVQSKHENIFSHNIFTTLDAGVISLVER